MRIISAAAILVFATGCICDGPVSTQFVSGINQVYFADSVANLVEPIIQFTYEVENGNESSAVKKPVVLVTEKTLLYESVHMCLQTA